MNRENFTDKNEGNFYPYLARNVKKCFREEESNGAQKLNSV